MIRKHTRRAAKAAFAISLGVAIVIGLVAAVFARPAHANRAAGPTIVLGTKNFGEEYILGQLYKQALEAKGFKVSYKENIGSTEIIHTALTSHKINMYPEYTGVVVQDVYHHTLSANTGQATYQEAKQLEAAKGITALTPTPFFDTDVLAVTNATAKKYGLKSIGDLKKVGAFKLGGFPECKTRNTCFLGYTKQYGLSKATFVPLGDLVAPAEEPPDIEPRRLDGAVRVPCRLDELRRAEHRLRRHACPVRALAADEPSFDERDPRPLVEPAEGADEMLAGRPSTENDDVQGRLAC